MLSRTQAVSALRRSGVKARRWPLEAKARTEEAKERVERGHVEPSRPSAGQWATGVTAGVELGTLLDFGESREGSRGKPERPSPHIALRFARVAVASKRSAAGSAIRLPLCMSTTVRCVQCRNVKAIGAGQPLGSRRTSGQGGHTLAAALLLEGAGTLPIERRGLKAKKRAL